VKEYSVGKCRKSSSSHALDGIIICDVFWTN